MKNVSIVLGILEGDENPLQIHNYMSFHMVFDAKIYFNRKDRYVPTGCHATKSNEILYVEVVSEDSVCIGSSYADLNYIDTMTADIQNDYLTVPWYEKYWRSKNALSMQ